MSEVRRTDSSANLNAEFERTHPTKQVLCQDEWRIKSLADDGRLYRCWEWTLPLGQL